VDESSSRRPFSCVSPICVPSFFPLLKLAGVRVCPFRGHRRKGLGSGDVLLQIGRPLERFGDLAGGHLGARWVVSRLKPIQDRGGSHSALSAGRTSRFLFPSAMTASYYTTTPCGLPSCVPRLLVNLRHTWPPWLVGSRAECLFPANDRRRGHFPLASLMPLLAPCLFRKLRTCSLFSRAEVHVDGSSLSRVSLQLRGRRRRVSCFLFASHCGFFNGSGVRTSTPPAVVPSPLSAAGE